MQLAKILLMSPGSCRHAKLGVRRMNEAAQVDHMHRDVDIHVGRVDAIAQSAAYVLWQLAQKLSRLCMAGGVYTERVTPGGQKPSICCMI